MKLIVIYFRIYIFFSFRANLRHLLLSIHTKIEKEMIDLWSTLIVLGKLWKVFTSLLWLHPEEYTTSFMALMNNELFPSLNYWKNVQKMEKNGKNGKKNGWRHQFYWRLFLLVLKWTKQKKTVQNHKDENIKQKKEKKENFTKKIVQWKSTTK